MVKSAAAILILAFALLAAAPAAAQNVEQAFERGNAAFAEGDWATAAQEYRTLLDYGVRDARVHYNLGNAEFRMRRLGPAILQYEKAHRLDPADREILANLRFAQGFRFDRVEIEEPFVLFGALQRTQAVLGVSGQAVVVVVLFWLAAGVLAWGLARQGRLSAAQGWPLAILLVLLLLAGLSWWDSYERLELRELAVVQVPAAEILAGPGPSNPSLLTVHEGLTVVILDARDEWVQVSLPNGIHGWIQAATIGRV